MRNSISKPAHVDFSVIKKEESPNKSLNRLNNWHQEITSAIDKGYHFHWVMKILLNSQQFSMSKCSYGSQILEMACGKFFVESGPAILLKWILLHWLWGPDLPQTWVPTLWRHSLTKPAYLAKTLHPRKSHSLF